VVCSVFLYMLNVRFNGAFVVFYYNNLHDDFLLSNSYNNSANVRILLSIHARIFIVGEGKREA
jgi:hypothetical protein